MSHNDPCKIKGPTTIKNNKKIDNKQSDQNNNWEIRII